MASLAVKPASLDEIMWTRRSGRRDEHRGATDRYNSIIHVRYANTYVNTDDRAKQWLTSITVYVWSELMLHELRAMLKIIKYIPVLSVTFLS